MFLAACHARESIAGLIPCRPGLSFSHEQSPAHRPADSAPGPLATFHFILIFADSVLSRRGRGAAAGRVKISTIRNAWRSTTRRRKIAELTNRTVGGVVFKAYQLRLSLRSSRHVSKQAAIADPAEPEGNPRSVQYRTYATLNGCRFFLFHQGTLSLATYCQPNNGGGDTEVTCTVLSILWA
jgi:hypothetical protein